VRHQSAGGIVSSVGSDLPLLKECQLLPEEQILSCESAAGIGEHKCKAAKIEQDHRSSAKAMPQGNDEEQGR
jgi:hypothetical protein